MSKNIAVTLSLQNMLSEQIKPAVFSLETAKKATETAKGQLENYKTSLANAQENLKSHKESVESLKSSIIGQNEEYQNAKKRIDTLKNANKELDTQIANHSVHMTELAKTYGNNSEEYKNANVELKSLRQEHKNNEVAIKEQSTSLKELEKELINNSSVIKEAAVREESLKKAVESANNNVTTQQKEIGRLGSELKKINSDVEKSKKKFIDWGKSVGKSIDGAVKSALKWGSATIVGLGTVGFKKGLDTSINLEAYRTMLETATKDFEKTNKLMKNAEKLSISTPFDPEEVIQATATLESFGIDSEKWLSKIADAAGATNTTMEQATGAVKDALTKGEFRAFENLGVSKDMVIEAANKKFGAGKVFDKKGKVVNDEKFKIVLEEIMVSKFDGGADKLSKTIKGLWSTITGSINMGLAKILGMENGLIKTGSILDTLKNKMKQVTDLLNSWSDDGTLDTVAKNVNETFISIIEWVKKAYSFIKENKSTILAVVKFAGVFYIVVKAVLALKTAFAAIQIAITGVSMGITLLSNPVGWVVAAVIGFVYILYQLYQNCETVRNAVNYLWECWKGYATFMFEVGKDILSALLTPLQKLEEYLPDWAVKIIECFFPIINIIKGLGKVFDWINEKFFKEDMSKKIDVVAEQKENIEKNIEVATKITPQKIETPKIKSSKKAFEEHLDLPENKGLNYKKANAINNAKVTNTKNINSTNNIYLQGDVYGYSDFKEKVAGVLVDISKKNMANVT